LASKATEFDRITQNRGHHTVQGHSRSPNLVPIKSPQATSYQWLRLTYTLSRTFAAPCYCRFHCVVLIGIYIILDETFSLTAECRHYQSSV